MLYALATLKRIKTDPIFYKKKGCHVAYAANYLHYMMTIVISFDVYLYNSISKAIMGLYKAIVNWEKARNRSTSAHIILYT